LRGGSAYATGLGSTLEVLPPFPRGWTFLVIQPKVEVSTRDVYQASDGAAPSGQRSRQLMTALKDGRVEAALFGNDLEEVTARLFPPVDEVRRKLRAVCTGVHMTGSGSAFFAAFGDINEAQSARVAVEGLGLRSWLCRSVSPWPA
jgi:4-diphosphocytidyl-2C-methyl-D-erythritol kinase